MLKIISGYQLGYQCTDNWCGVAVAVSLIRFYTDSKNQTQCSFAKVVTKAEKCCANGCQSTCDTPIPSNFCDVNSDCDKGPELDTIFDALRTLSADIDYVSLDLKKANLQKEIKAKIERDQPVVVDRISPDGEHVIVIVGIENEEFMMYDSEGETKKVYFKSGIRLHDGDGNPGKPPGIVERDGAGGTLTYQVRQIFIHR